MVGCLVTNGPNTHEGRNQYKVAYHVCILKIGAWFELVSEVAYLPFRGKLDEFKSRYTTARSYHPG